MNRLTRPALLLSALLMVTACQVKDIPPRTASPAATALQDGPPAALRSGGRLVLEDRFDGERLADHWQTKHTGWVVKHGAAHSTRARNEGLWLTILLPASTRIEFDAWSEASGPPGSFAGDLKCEVFAEQPTHEAGYVLINGGWNNQLDVIARLDEHGRDRAEKPAAPVEPGTRYRWTIMRYEGEIYWYRDDVLLMTYPDASPLQGRHFGFNNWESHAYFDNLTIFDIGER